MSEQLQIFNLTLDTASHVPADKLLPGNDLEGNLLASAAMDSQLHFAKRALAQGLDDVVLADALIRLDLVGQTPGNGAGGRGGGHVGGVVAVDEDLGGAGRGVVDVGSAPSHLGGAEGDGKLAVVVGVGTYGRHVGQVCASDAR